MILQPKNIMKNFNKINLKTILILHYPKNEKNYIVFLNYNLFYLCFNEFLKDMTKTALIE